MVCLTSTLLKLQRTFIDSLRITVKGGRGGNGLPKYGGVGGKGGDVYVQACKNYTLRKLKQKFPNQMFKATIGGDSKRSRILGEAGEDVYVNCPVGVSVVSVAHRLLGDLNTVNDKVLVARGGCGGGPENDYLGQKGQMNVVTLDLKLLADVGFVGFPNAGKSTLLKSLSRAHPKIANYPFTTITPNVGVLEFEDFRKISLADLPGLIEGAHANYGMGHKFLKHCLRTKVLLMVVDVTGFRLSPNHIHRSAFDTVLLLNKELELYDEDLISKPVILAVNKVDKDSNLQKFKELEEMLRKRTDEDFQRTNFPCEINPQNMIAFDAVIPISALTGENIDYLKKKIRTIIDIYHELKQAELAKYAVQQRKMEDDESKSIMYV